MKYTPWGPSQYMQEVAEGITIIGTAGHGGIHLSIKRQKELIPEAGARNFNRGITWWEEDCDWSVVYLSFPQIFRAYDGERFTENYAAASRIAQQCHPEFYWALHAI